MRAGVSICAALLLAAGAFMAAPAAAQDATAPDLTATPPDATGTETAAPLTPEEATALGDALSYDPTHLADAGPAKLRLPSLGDAGKIDINHGNAPDAPSTLTMRRPLDGDWAAKVGADVNLTTPTDGAALSRPLPLTGNSQDSGAAWASVGYFDLASVDARVDPGSDQGKLGTTLKRAFPIGKTFSVTLQDTYSVTQSVGTQAAAPPDVPLMTAPAGAPATVTPQVWGNQPTVKFDVQTTGTSFGAGITTASNDPVTHNTFSADQKLYGPLHVTTAVTDVGQPTASKSITAGLKLNW
jgi:hypothetical protein